MLKRTNFYHIGRLILLTAVISILLAYQPGKTRAYPVYAQSAAGMGTSIFAPLILKEVSSGGPPSTTEAPAEDWLAYINYYRAMAELPPVSENQKWSVGSFNHSLYMVKNNVVGHSEDPSREFYTPEGDKAARSANLVVSNNYENGYQYAIDTWMQAPFHAVAIIDPALLQVGYGLYREHRDGVKMGATLDVLRGRGKVPSSVEYPVMWPADGTTVPIRRHWGEIPSPITSCPGYREEGKPISTGLPVILQIGPGNLVPNVTGHSFSRGEVLLEHCVFDETSYENENVSERNLGRSILAARDAIVLIPRHPLEAGETYTVSITVGAQTYTWSFTVAADQLEFDMLEFDAIVR